MTDDFKPGIYVEEFDSGPRPIEGVPTTIAGAVGVTERGPADKPTLVTSFREFRDIFGGYVEGPTGRNPLAASHWWRFANSIEGFFANGGQRVYVQRVVTDDSKTATLSQSSTPGDTGEGGNKFGLAPNSTGAWGSRLAVSITPIDTMHKLVEVKVSLSHNGVLEDEEVLSDLKYDSTDPNDPQLYTTVINQRSRFLTATEPTTGYPSTAQLLTGCGGNDDIDSLQAADFEKSLSALEKIEDISIVMAPGIANKAVIDALLLHCEQMRYRFAIFEAGYESDETTVQEFRRQFDSPHGAMYYPWLKVVQPDLLAPVECPPSGHIAGIYADVDTRRGVHKAPANEIICGISSIAMPVDRSEQDVLNARGINVLRHFPGRGNRVWGSRTVASDSNFKYVSVRRLFHFIEASIDRGTQFVVFEPNDETLWSRVRTTIGNFLLAQWRNGVLQGTTPEEAFYVACDRGVTMTQDDIENGRLIVEVGISPIFPAEFVIFRIQHFTADSKLA